MSRGDVSSPGSPTLMKNTSRRSAAVRGFAWGAVAGLALVALMYLAALFIGLRPLPQALSGPLLALMPGFVFGFLIDTLQHAGKVVEEFGLIVAMVVGLGVVPLAIGAASLGVLALRLVPDWYRAVFNPPEAGLSGASPEITPVANFYVVSKNFGDPVVAADGWKLGVGGAV